MTDETAKVLLVAPGDSAFRRLDLKPRYRLEHVADLDSAMARAQANEYAAVLLEMTRPDESAWAVFDRLQVGRPERPILVLARHEEEGAAIRALREGAQDYLVQPGVDADELSRAVRFAVERHRMVRDRQASLERLRELERFKTQFINTAAHELNSPLTPVKLQLHLLHTTQEKGLDEKQLASLNIIDRNVDRLVALVADILDAARLQADRLLIRKEPVDLRGLAKDAVESSREAAKRAGVRLELTAKEGVVVEADPDRINQVLFNLISNAVKFTPEGGRVVISVAREGDFAELRVSDSGVGLRKEDFTKLFQPFGQAHEWTSGHRSGSGLGLYISQGIIQQHGGRIWVDSVGPNEGATFSFALPMPGKPIPEPKAAPARPAGVRKDAGFWKVLYFRCPTCGSGDIDMRILRNRYECRACTDEWR